MKTNKLLLRVGSARATAPCVLGMGWQSLLMLGVASAVLLVACSSGPKTETVPPTRTPKPTFTVAVSTPTAVPSPTPIPTSTATATPSPTPTPTVNPYLNPLTGQMVQDPAVLQRRPLLVRIGNDAEVRPQSGLSQADMVFEEAMDGWYITRMTAIVWSQDPEVLKPIRSARLFTIELGHMFDGALVHSGANDEVRWLISQSGLTDLDEYFHPDPYYYIEPEGNWKDYPWMGRVVTGAKRLRDYLTQTGREKAVHLAGFTFSGEGDPAPQGEPATYFLVPYPKRALVEYRYDAEKHVYERWVQGEPHVDALNGEQLASANVIVHYTKYEETDVKDVNGNATFNIISTGEGRAQIFRDGVVIEAKWVRPATEDFVKYVYLDGTPVPLRPGQTWVEVVPLEYQITVGE
jgi:hypothetical protein